MGNVPWEGGCICPPQGLTWIHPLKMRLADCISGGIPSLPRNRATISM